MSGSEYDPHDPWIETYSGKRFHFLNPRQDEIDIEDIAHALSNTCRYTGHCRSFYSVAEHSYHVSRITGTLEGLLHDASEAYIADIAKPVKGFLYNYHQIEGTIMSAIARKFGFGWPLSRATHEADLAQLSAEAYALLPSKGEQWDWSEFGCSSRPTNGRGVLCLDPTSARSLFLGEFEKLVVYGEAA